MHKALVPGAALLAAARATAQPAASPGPGSPASLLVQVVDASGGGIPRAHRHHGRRANGRPWNREAAGGRGRGPGRRQPPSEAHGASRGRTFGFGITARNVFNQPHYGSFNGVLTSPLFGRPVSAQNPRRVDVGVNVGF